MKRCNSCAAMHRNGEKFYCEFLEVILDIKENEEPPCIKQ